MRRCLNLDSGQLQALLLSDIDVRRGSITFFQSFIQQLPQQQKQIRIQTLHLFKLLLLIAYFTPTLFIDSATRRWLVTSQAVSSAISFPPHSLFICATDGYHTML
ncbi:hypothetical protein NXS19_012292 [Fusarium pseudograminearum]|nr:hypothetical protein NXS19_012292 [Fusarium pseudograminearum]